MTNFARRLKEFAGDETFNKLVDSLPDIEARGKLRFWQETLLERFEQQTGITVPQLDVIVKVISEYDDAQEKTFRYACDAGINKQIIGASVTDFDKVVDFLISKSNIVIGCRWQGDKEGYHTLLAHHIDFMSLFAIFEFSDEVDVSRRHQYIRTKKDWLEIRHEVQ